MSLLLLLCEHRQVPQIEDFFSNFSLNFSPPNPEFQITKGGWRSGWTAFGPEPSASQVSTPLLVSFPWLSFVGEVSVTAAALDVSGPQGALRALIKWRHVEV